MGNYLKKIGSVERSILVIALVQILNLFERFPWWQKGPSPACQKGDHIVMDYEKLENKRKKHAGEIRTGGDKQLGIDIFYFSAVQSKTILGTIHLQ